MTFHLLSKIMFSFKIFSFRKMSKALTLGESHDPANYSVSGTGSYCCGHKLPFPAHVSTSGGPESICLFWWMEQLAPHNLPNNRTLKLYCTAPHWWIFDFLLFRGVKTFGNINVSIVLDLVVFEVLVKSGWSKLCMKWQWNCYFLDFISLKPR